MVKYLTCLNLSISILSLAAVSLTLLPGLCLEREVNGCKMSGAEIYWVVFTAFHRHIIYGSAKCISVKKQFKLPNFAAEAGQNHLYFMIIVYYKLLLVHLHVLRSKKRLLSWTYTHGNTWLLKHLQNIVFCFCYFFQCPSVTLWMLLPSDGVW